MSELVQRFYNGLASYLTENKAISAEELFWIIEQEVNALAENEKIAIEKVLGDDLIQTVFDGITGEIKISVFSPDMHVKMNFLGEEFYCPPTHKYMPDELENGFKRLVQLRFNKNFQLIKDIINNFMIKSGYKISETQSPTPSISINFKAAKNGHDLLLYLYPSIVLVHESLETLKELSDDFILVVPTEKTPAPFINFVRGNRDALMGKTNIMIWVINIDNNTISPIVGRPKDQDIWNNFTEPEQSLQATQNWIQGALRSWRLDEDF